VSGVNSNQDGGRIEIHCKGNDTGTNMVNTNKYDKIEVKNDKECQMSIKYE
jgi:hypothetical protein